MIVIPTITEIRDRIVSDVEDKIGQDIPILPLAFIRVLAGSLAGVAFLLYLAIHWIYKQIFPQTAETQALIMHGEIVNLVPKSASPAVLLCTVPGSGNNVSAGINFIASNGLVYKVMSNQPIVDGAAVDVPMIALTAGEIGNLAVGEVLNITSANMALSGTATVTALETPASNEEDIESFRGRVVGRYKHRTAGGAPYDYYTWGMECPNFIWVGPYNDTNILTKRNIYGKVDNQPDGIPSESQLDNLGQYLVYDYATGKQDRAPIGDIINTLPIVIHEFDVQITIQNATPELLEQIHSAIDEYLKTFEPYIEGISDSRQNTITNSNVSNIANDLAIENNATVISIVITDVETAEPITGDKYVLLAGEFAKARDITFVEE